MSSVFNYEQAELSILDNAYVSLHRKHKALMDSWLSNGYVDIQSIEESNLTQQVDQMLETISDQKRQLAENKDKLDSALDSKRHHNRPQGAGVVDMATLGGTLTIGMALKETVRGIFNLVTLPFRSKEGLGVTMAAGGTLAAYRLLDATTKKAMWDAVNSIAAQGAWAAAPYVGYAFLGIGAVVTTGIGLKKLGNKISNWWSNRSIRQLRDARVHLLRDIRRITRHCHLIERELDAEIDKHQKSTVDSQWAFEPAPVRSSMRQTAFIPMPDVPAYVPQYQASIQRQHQAPDSYRAYPQYEPVSHYAEPYVDAPPSAPPFEGFDDSPSCKY